MARYRLLSLNTGLIFLLILLAESRIGDYGFPLLASVFALFILFSIKSKYFVYLVTIILLIPFVNQREDIFTRNLQRYEDYYGKDLVVEGVVLEDAVYGYKRQVEFYINDVSLQGEKLIGKIKVSGFGVIEVKRGDTVEVSGQLRSGYGSYQGQISYAEYNVINRTENILENFRHKFIFTAYTLLPEPQASLGLGFLAGFRSLLPEHLTTALSVTGLTHIVAVSGYNTTIIANFVQRLLAKFGSRFQVMIATAIVLLLFLAITGLAPSIIRACIVSGLGLVTWFYGRKFNPYTLLILSALISAYLYPLDYWYSLGWWLSFMAFFGILIIAPALINRYRLKNSLLKLAVETSSAQIMTLPLIMWVFNKVSAVALITNLLVLPFIPFVMLFTFLATFIAIFAFNIGALIVFPAKWLMDYMLQIIYMFSSSENSLISLEIDKAQMIIIYSVLIVLSGVLYIKTKKQSIISPIE